MNIQPLHDRILIKPFAEEELSAGGIVIPDTAKEKTYRGEVVALGSGKLLEDGKTRPVSVKVGDKVLYGKYTGTEVKIGGEDHLIINEDEVLGVFVN